MSEDTARYICIETENDIAKSKYIQHYLLTGFLLKIYLANPCVRESIVQKRPLFGKGQIKGSCQRPQSAEPAKAGSVDRLEIC